MIDTVYGRVMTADEYNLNAQLINVSQALTMVTKSNLDNAMELEIYRNALKLACVNDGVFSESKYESFLSKAREDISPMISCE